MHRGCTMSLKCIYELQRSPGMWKKNHQKKSALFGSHSAVWRNLLFLMIHERYSWDRWLVLMIHGGIFANTAMILLMVCWHSCWDILPVMELSWFLGFWHAKKNRPSKYTSWEDWDVWRGGQGDSLPRLSLDVTLACITNMYTFQLLLLFVSM